MVAAVATAAGNQLLPHQAARLLRQPGQGVILRQDADDRTAAAEAGGEGGGNTADALFHSKALFFQDFAVFGAGLFLLQGQLRIFPNAVCHIVDDRFFRLHGVDRSLLFICHDTRPSFFQAILQKDTHGTCVPCMG